MDAKLIEQLKIELSKPLPGKIAHKKMSPLRRFPINESPNILKSKVGAVLILLYQKDDKWHIPLILRPTYDGEHSGQISLPGGKVEKTDRNIAETALRETEEEIGIKASDIEIIGQLTTIYIPKSNYLVHPFVGYLPINPNFLADAKEVDQILEMPLTLLSDNSKIDVYSYIKSDIMVTAPCWNLGEHAIWGATAMILSEFNDLFDVKLEDKA